jgi:hypothetical protein
MRPPKDIVCDSIAGSGSMTAAAALYLGGNGIILQCHGVNDGASTLGTSPARVKL